MLEYIQKFNNLPKDLRDKVSAPAVMSAIEELEKRYEVNLAAAVMKIMVKEIGAGDMAECLASEFGLGGVKAKQLERDLKQKVFFNAADYLGIKKADGDEKEQIDELIAQVAEKEKAASPLAGSGAEADLSRQIRQPAAEAGFYFHPEDEEEIRELAKKTDGRAQGRALADNIEGKLDEIIKKTKINFGSAILIERFKQILKTHLRGIRDKISTKQTLAKPFNSGGLGFDNDSIDRVLSIADSVAQSAKQNFAAWQPLSQAPGVSGVRDAEYDLAAELRKKESFKANRLDTQHELAPLLPMISPQAPARQPEPAKTPQTSQTPPAPPQTEPFLTQNIIVKPLPVSDYGASAEQVIIKRSDAIKAQAKPEGKPKMEDVKFMPKVFGPVDELQYMDLANFRRLAKNPANIIEKIRKKINLLEEDSFIKRLEGIKAWRNNPINRLYLRMGQASISENKPINAIIEEWQTAGRECLNNQEFEAVTDLNRELRF